MFMRPGLVSPFCNAAVQMPRTFALRIQCSSPSQAEVILASLSTGETSLNHHFLQLVPESTEPANPATRRGIEVFGATLRGLYLL